MAEAANIIFISHGGGPLPLLGDPSHQAMREFLQVLPSKIPTPDIILVLSAHWLEPEATLLSAEHPQLFFDYYGFPPESYQVTYPAPGCPDFSLFIASLLVDNKIPAHFDPMRGYDHGCFIPLKLMYPQANIPCVQLSLLRSLDPAAHLALGKALRPLKAEKVLIIGSGFTFHNLMAFSADYENEPDAENDAFQDWLIDTLTNPKLTQAEREQRMLQWTEAPYARYCHPYEDHLLPLFVCAALAERPARVIFDDTIIFKRSLAFQW